MSVSVRVSVTVVGGQTGARRGHGTTGLRAHAGTPNGSPGPPILDPGTQTLNQAGDEARGQTGARPDHGTTGPRAHASTQNESPEPPILDRAHHDQSYHESKKPRQAPLFGE